MRRVTDVICGYCEVHCSKYGSCFGEDPNECYYSEEVDLYERLKEFENIGLTPNEIIELKDELDFTRRFIIQQDLMYALGSAWDQHKRNLS